MELGEFVEIGMFKLSIFPVRKSELYRVSPSGHF